MTETISKECRWFLTSEKIQPIKIWFDGLQKPQWLGDTDTYPRQDYYLVMPGVKNLGIKIREPKKDAATGKIKTALEVKRQISEDHQIEIGNNNHAYTNKWQKLSYDLTEDGTDLISLNSLLPAPGSSWLRVDKDRLLAKYDAEAKSIAEGNSFPDEGCGIELTRIKIKNSLYYSFGLEALSKSGQKLDENFSGCCNFIFGQMSVTGMALESSLSYPEFLAMMI